MEQAPERRLHHGCDPLRVLCIDEPDAPSRAQNQFIAFPIAETP
jgi:hypothetical protein